MSSPRLSRSISDRMIAGVCGGLGKYFNIDATIVRLVFLLFLFLGGGGFLLYIVLWFVMPDEQRVGTSLQDLAQTNPQEPPPLASDFGQSVGQAARNGPLLFAVILIFLGFWFLLQNLLHIDLGQLWPVILIIIGLALLVPTLRRS